ncbi:hypothetical protein H0H81_012489 [Sphagnurus paluster]|uniref:Cytochrome P450 n=1 Tax=Sphagnurus paluster TaxID=117069 RepID=A0A9P7GHW9_9AGAR|nr:hypothetical protein H0H81_012489 [Sphagnurus paluster]
MELMQNEDAKGIWNVMEDAQPNALLLGHLPWLAKFAIQIPGAAKKIKKFREFSRRRVMRRYKEGSGQKDLLYHLMDEGGIDAEPPAMNQVASDASLIIIAGSDTVSPSLSSLFYYLISNPLAYARLQTEIDESKLSAEDVQGLSKLKYLNAVINETMRLIPPLLDGSMRSPLIGSGGHMLGEHHIPEGTTTNLHMFTLHRDHRNFSPSPDKFLPERWLPADDQVALEPDIFKNRKSIIHNIAAFIPFSYGPADCIGKQMAMREMRWVVVAILKRFTMRFADGYDPAIWEGEIRDYFVIKKPKLSIVMMERA